MSKTPIRVGVVGAGANTTSMHIPKLQAISGVEIVSVCNRSHESSARVAQQFGIPKIYQHWTDLVAADDTNAIVIGTWPYMHCPITLAALDAGKHVLCEARMAMDATQAHAMRDAARIRPGQVLQIVPSPYTLPVDRTIQRLIAEGFLGDLLAIEIRAPGGAFLDPDAPIHWRQDTDLSGRNIMGLGIWYEAVLRWVGPAARVTAMGQTFAKLRRDAQTGLLRAVQVPEHLDVVAEMVCGAQAHFMISSIAGLSGGPEAWLFGSQGTLRFADGLLAGGQRGDSALLPIQIRPEDQGGWRVEEEFVASIHTGATVTRTNADDGVKYMEFTEAVGRSIAEGRTVALPLL